jgi:hypothetical protein
MIQRCENPNNPAYKHYGERGIAVHPGWREFANFIADMGAKPTPAHTLERIDNNGNYEPGNCKRATQKEQCQNMRRSLSYEYDGRVLTISQWSEETGLGRKLITSRLERGWSIERALTTPSAPPKPPRGVSQPKGNANSRKTHCPQGHPYDAENTGRIKTEPRVRYCKQCNRERARSKQ